MKKRVALAAAAVLAITLSGCGRVQMNLVLSEDDTADVEMIMAVDDQVMKDLQLEDYMETLDEEPPFPGATAERYAQDGYTGWVYTSDDESFTYLSGDGFDLSRDGDEYVVEATLDDSDFEMDASDIEEMKSMGYDDPEITINVTFPGEVTEHNGELNGTTVTWHFTQGEVLEMSARGMASADGTAPDDDETTEPADDETTEPGDDGTDKPSDEASDDASEDAKADKKDDSEGINWILWGGIGGGALVLIGLVVWLVVRNKNGGSGGPGQGGPGGYAPVGTPGAWGQPAQGQPAPGQPGQQAPQQWGPPAQQQAPQQWGPPGQQPPAQPPAQQQPPTQWGPPGQQPPGQQPPAPGQTWG